MADKQRRGGLGRGLGALIPTAPQRTHAEPAEPAPAADDQAAASEQPDQPAAVGDNSSSSSDEGASGSADVSDTAGVAGGERASDSETGGGPSDSSSAAPPADGGTALRPVAGAEFAELPVDAIVANPRQPRQVFDEEALLELAHSIREFGVLQPVVVRRLPAAPTDATGDAAAGDTAAGDTATGRFELVMGERRLRAAQLADLPAVPAIIRSTADDAMLRDALLENIHRAQLNPLEEAAAYQQLLEEFGTTHEELAQRIGRSRPQITNTIRLLNLSVPVQRRVAAGVLSAGHARALLGLPDTGAQDELAGRIVAEGLSVRATEELVALQVRNRGTGETGPKSAGHRPRLSAPGAEELAERLADVFDTRVRVELGRRKGKVVVEFASLDDLERIIGLMAPQVSRRAGGVAARSTGEGTDPAADPAGDAADNPAGVNAGDPAGARG